MSRKENVTIDPGAQFLLVYNSLEASDAAKLAAAKVFFKLPPEAILSKASIHNFKPNKANTKDSLAFTEAYKLLRQHVASQEVDELTSMVVSDLSDDEQEASATDIQPQKNVGDVQVKNAVMYLFSMMDDAEEEDKIQEQLSKIRSLLAIYQGQIDDLLQMLRDKRAAYENTGLTIAEVCKNAFNTLEQSFLCMHDLNQSIFDEAIQRDKELANGVIGWRINAKGPLPLIPMHRKADLTTHPAPRSDEPQPISELTLPAKIGRVERIVHDAASTMHIPTLLTIRKMQIECLAEYLKQPKTQTLERRLFTNRATLKARLDHALNRAPKQDKVFYSPLLKNMAFFDQYLLDQVYGKKKHASKRISYCIAFMQHLTIQYESNKMDQPLIELLKNLYRLKGLLLCEAHDQGSYMASLFHCAMTSALAKHVTSEISKIETMLRGAHKKKSRLGTATATGNLARISDTDIDTDSDIQAKRAEIQVLNDAYGTGWRRFKTALFSARPALTTQSEKDLASTWRGMTL